jgi:RNA polymerase sigma-70 factor (ECF subfamily)
MQAELVERAMRGDHDAFAALASGSVDRCYAIAYRILRDVHLAEDATQQALLGAWRDLPTLREPGRFDAWLHRLVVHACYIEARRGRRWTAAVRALPPDDRSVPDTATTVSDRDQLERAFRELTPEQRAVIVLHHHQGYPLTEVAAILGIPEGTARSRLHHANQRARAAIEADARIPSAKERTA